MEEALKYFDDEVILFKELYEANPRSEELKKNLAISYERLGSIHQSMGHLEEAFKYFDDEVILFKELYEANPRSESLKNGLAISYSKLGDIHQLDLPVKLTSSRRFILTTFRRSKLTRYFQY